MSAPAPGSDRLVRGTELLGLPVVTWAGDDVAEIRDVVYEPGAGRLVGFTLNKRGFLAGHHRNDLPVKRVASLGRDAVMIEDIAALEVTDDATSATMAASSERNVLGSVVLTEDGRRLGSVHDVVILSGRSPRVEGYVLATDGDDRPKEGQTVFIPLPEQVAVSGDALVVPNELAGFVRDDLAGFGAAVADFRASHAQARPSAPKHSASPPHAAKGRSKSELYAEASRRKIPGRSAMTKAELERAIEQTS